MELFCHYLPSQYGPRREKTCLRGFANNKGTDQPVHPCRLISAFVFHSFESIISRVAKSGISIFKLVPVPEQASLNLTLSETLKTGFPTRRPIYGWTISAIQGETKYLIPFLRLVIVTYIARF